MAKAFYTSGTGSQQTLSEIESDKIPVYNSTAEADADLSNLEENQIIATEEDEAVENGTQYPVNVVEKNNMHAVTSNAVANIFSSPIDNTKFSITSASTYITAQYTGICYLTVYSNDQNTTNVFEDDVPILADDNVATKTLVFLVRKGHQYKYERATNFVSCNFIPFNI